MTSRMPELKSAFCTAAMIVNTNEPSWPLSEEELFGLEMSTECAIGITGCRKMREDNAAETAIQSLPADKSSGADDIPAKPLKQGEGNLATLMTTLCQKIWETQNT